MDAIEQLFRTKEHTFQVIREARELFTNNTTTEKQYEAMETTLAFVLLYCPEELLPLVESTLYEAHRRKVHFIFKIWRVTKNDNTLLL